MITNVEVRCRWQLVLDGLCRQPVLQGSLQ